MTTCSTCKHRVKEIRFTGFSTVRWTGRWQCDKQFQSHDWKLRRNEEGDLLDLDQSVTTGCDSYEPERQRGQTALEAWL